MSTPSNRSRTSGMIADEAADWVLRCDRGLSAAEQDDLSLWLAASPRHRAALAEQRWGWEELDRLAGLQTTIGAPPDPDLLAPRSTRHRGSLLNGRGGKPRPRWWTAPLALAAAAAVALGAYFLGSRDASRPPPVAVVARTDLAAPCERLTLEDGSVLELNRGAAIERAFNAGERRVRLLRGEASFSVAKDAARPFVVEAGTVAVHAIGTVFNVRLDPTAVEVLVTEGRVGVERVEAGANKPVEDNRLHLEPNERALISLTADAAPAVDTLTPSQLSTRLAWQPRLLDFTDAPLEQIVAEFNRRNVVRLTIADPALAGVRLSATFRSDNVEGFVRLMESDFHMRAEWRGEREIALRRAR